LDLMKHGTDVKFRRDVERLYAQSDAKGRKVVAVVREFALDDEEIVVDGAPIEEKANAGTPGRRASRSRGKADLAALEAQLARTLAYKITDANREKVQDEVARLQAQIADAKRSKTPRRRAAPGRQPRVRASDPDATAERASLGTLASVAADVSAEITEMTGIFDELLASESGGTGASEEAEEASRLETILSISVDIASKSSLISEGTQALLSLGQPPDPASTAKRIATFDALRSLMGVVGKIGARNSAADLAIIQNVHDSATALGATCSGPGDEVVIEDDAQERALVRAIAETAVWEAVQRATGRVGP
jgi:hypothetical protein